MKSSEPNYRLKLSVLRVTGLAETAASDAPDRPADNAIRWADRDEDRHWNPPTQHDWSNMRSQRSLLHEHSEFPGSRFVDVDLSDSVFHDVGLQRATFENVALAGARFRNVNLSQASIEDANLEGMTINGVQRAEEP